MASSNISDSHMIAEEATTKIFENGEHFAKKMVEEDISEKLNLSDTKIEILQIEIKKLYLEEAN